MAPQDASHQFHVAMLAVSLAILLVFAPEMLTHHKLLLVFLPEGHRHLVTVTVLPPVGRVPRSHIRETSRGVEMGHSTQVWLISIQIHGFWSL